jgi:hypothetical protein
MDSRLRFQFACACSQARQMGQAEPSFAEFKEGLKKRPFWDKLDEQRKTRAKFLYRRGGELAINGRTIQGISCYAFSMVLQPLYVVKKMLSQLGLARLVSG